MFKILKTAIALVPALFFPLNALSAEVDYTNPANEAANYKILNESNQQNNTFNFVNFISPKQQSVDNTLPDTIGYKNYESAVKKFVQGNTDGTYKDLINLIDEIEKEDFLYVLLADKFANLGFFSLAKNVIERISDKSAWNLQTNLINTKYFPKQELSREDEIYLSGLYSDIYFHNLSFEVIRELSKKDKVLKRSDYACYIYALAYYEAKEYKKALSMINKALDAKPDNINYQKTKAQILCELKEYKQANKIMDKIVNNYDNFSSLKQELSALQQYILAKSSSKEYIEKYHLGKYFYLKNDRTRAVKLLNQVIALKKNYYPAMVLIGHIYLQENNFQKANEYYLKAYKFNKNYSDTLFGIGELQFKEGNVQKALNYFLVAARKDKHNISPLLYSAMCYKILNQPEIALKLCNDALAISPQSPDVYYMLSKIEPQNKIAHLKEVTSYNPFYIDAWLDLAYNSIKSQKLKEAKNYLMPVKYIDSDNYKAYYYQGLIEKYERNDKMALMYFEKSISINPNYEPALNEVKSEI